MPFVFACDNPDGCGSGGGLLAGLPGEAKVALATAAGIVLLVTFAIAVGFRSSSRASRWATRAFVGALCLSLVGMALSDGSF